MKKDTESKVISFPSAKSSAYNADHEREANVIGSKIDESVTGFFSNENNRAIIERLRNAGLQMSLSADRVTRTSDKLAGKSIVISGVFAKHSRDEYKKLIEQNGGKNVGSISSKTDFILAGENMGPAKLEKANKLAIPIINEDQFLNMIE